MPLFLLPFVAKLLPIGGFLKKHALWFLFGLFAFAMIGGGVFLYSKAHKAGANEVEVRVEREHTTTIREVRTDEQLAQKITDALDNRLAAQNAQSTADTDQTLKDIQDALAARPTPAPGAVVDVVSSDVLAASNSIVSRANRAADYTGPAD